MKKLRSLLLILLGMLFALSLAACGGGEEEENVTRYTVTFQTMGEQQVAPYSLQEGETIERPADPTYPNFTFAGWYADEACTTPYTFGQPMPAQDVTVYAKWTPLHSSRIEYNSMGGSAVDPSVGVVGSAYTRPADPTYAGYRFGGWYTDRGYNNLFTASVFPAEDITLYAKWVGNTDYAYIEYIGNGVRLARVPVLKGTKWEDPALIGDEFVSSGWYTDAALTAPYAAGSTVTANLTLYASYYTKGLQIGGGTVRGYDGTYNTVVVPNYYEGTQVTAIGENAFAEKTGIVSVSLPQTVTAIGTRAFYRCEYLETVNLSANVTELGSYAFFGCSRLVGYGDITGVNVIPDGLFLGCKKLEAVTLSANATSLGTQVFADCEALREVVIPSRVTAVNDGLFDGCKSLTKVTLPAALASFGTNVFVNCGKLATIELDRSNNAFKVLDGNLYRGNGTELLFYACGTKGEKQFRVRESTERIAAGAFDANATLEGIVVNNASTQIECGAFANIKALASLTVPALGGDTGYLAYYFGAAEPETTVRYSNCIPETLHTVTLTGSPDTIANYAFYGAAGLETVSGLGEVTAIGEYAFANTGLTEFEIPASLSSIKNSAFQGCSRLGQFTMQGEGTFSVYDGCLYEGTKLRSVPSLKTSVSFKEGTDEIANGAFSESRIEEVVIPESVTFIDYAAFRVCNSLKSISVPYIGSRPEQLNYLGYIFGATLKLSDQTGSDGYTHKGMTIDNANMIPTSLQTVTITGECNSIPDMAFAYFRGLENVVLPADSVVESIGAFAFYSTKVAEWDFTGLESIGDGAFWGGALTSVTLPGTLDTVSYAAFRMIEPLQSITLGEGIRKIEREAFFAPGESDATVLHQVALHSAINSELVIPSTVEEIGNDAFYGIGSMLPTGGRRNQPNANFSLRFARRTGGGAETSLTTIGDGAFAYSGLRTVEIPESVTYIGVQSFLYCDHLTSVTFGSAEKESALEEIGGLGFAGCTALTDLTMYVSSLVTMDLYENKVSGTYSVFWDIFYEASTSFSVYVPESMVETFRTAENWSKYATKIFAVGTVQGGGN